MARDSGSLVVITGRSLSGPLTNRKIFLPTLVTRSPHGVSGHASGSDSANSASDSTNACPRSGCMSAPYSCPVTDGMCTPRPTAFTVCTTETRPGAWEAPDHGGDPDGDKQCLVGAVWHSGCRSRSQPIPTWKDSIMIKKALLAGALGVTLAMTGAVTAHAGQGHGHHRKAVVVGERDSIQAAIDAAEPGTRIQVRGDHAEQVWINKDGIELVGKRASLSMPTEPDFEGPCGPTLICVIPDNENNFGNPFDPANVYLNDVTISGFNLSNPFFDSIGLYFTNGATVERNTVTESGCSGIWMLFANDFSIERNNVNASADCGNIDVAASNGGTISRNRSTDGAFAGINIDDVSDVVINRNTSTGNCIGIVAADSPGPLPSSNVTINRNKTNRNNTVCYPFAEFEGDVSLPVGVAGILVVGPTDVVVSRNTSNNNVSTDPAGSITAGGIVIQDFVTGEGSNISSDVLVKRNTARGNSTVDGPLDISVTSTGSAITVTRNHCQFGAPDTDWCTN